jgi:hypothetical protein
MEQAATSPASSSLMSPDDSPISAPTTDEFDAAHVAIRATIERLDSLGLNDERGRAIVEPAAAFHWS